MWEIHFSELNILKSEILELVQNFQENKISEEDFILEVNNISKDAIFKITMSQIEILEKVATVYFVILKYFIYKNLNIPHYKLVTIGSTILSKILINKFRGIKMHIAVKLINYFHKYSTIKNITKFNKYFIAPLNQFPILPKL